MNLHEYQAKQLFADYGIPIPSGKAAESLAEAVEAAHVLGGDQWAVKAQVHAGGRGKGGGIKLISNISELETAVSALLGSKLVTPQTDSVGLPVNTVLIEKVQPFSRELYLGVLVDRQSERIIVMASAAGGMDIEAVAADTPEKIHTVAIDPIVGLQSYQCRQLGFALELDKSQFGSFGKLLQNLYRLYLEKDCSLAEINPMVVTDSGDLVALDAKLVIDDNALYRLPAIKAMADASQEDETEHKAEKLGLNYITLEGDIACMVNGAGLAMATMDLIKLHGGKPANFLDVGGGTTAERVTEAFKLILADHKVNAILVNIFGGIVRCDLIATGIINAVKEVGINIPVVVRLEGTNVEQGKTLLQESHLSIVTAENLTKAAEQAVTLAARNQ
ncbi:MAG: ADP-forming succinate--CoA ligase subunit beta [Gammaproteobacteria bacterium]|nr:ADP-forming succinate--CoA ligase subunit beta [Gammaproteobacteria bacterium]